MATMSSSHASAALADGRSSVVPTGMVETVDQSLPRVVRCIADRISPLRIILFGSYAYGTPTPDSDVDLFVEIAGPSSSDDHYLAVARAVRPRPFPIDLIVMTADEVRAGLAAGDVLVTEILGRGRVLYERPT